MTSSFPQLLGAVALGAVLMNASHAHQIERVEPANWWAGMRDPHLQLMVHGDRIAELTPTLQHAGVRIEGVHRLDSPNYLFIDLKLNAGARPGTVELRFQQHGQTVLRHSYPLLAREPGSAQRQGFGPKDAIYLVVPDRFAQGDPTLTARSGMLEGSDRNAPGGRHGGDIAGLRQHLDYIAGMGFTQLWATPLVENNAPSYSYHGYGITDFYKVDPRFGSHADYRELVQAAKGRGIGVIQDIVLNHIGAGHWWMRDLPSQDWLNQWPQFTETHHARATVQDPHAAPSDRRRFTDGWFTQGMPDLNQRQPLLANYLIQMSLWWIESTGLSGIRTDTYSYSDKAFLARWSKRVMQEYPNLNIVGEEWSPHPAIVAYWQRGKRNHDGYVSHAPSMMDFPLHGALLAGLQENDSHDAGFTKLYEALAHDFVYADAANLVLFDGNHDTPRLHTALHEDLALTKMAMVYLATTQRIPQFFYGTELLLTSPRERDDGRVRADFPGGWAGDVQNGFSGAGLRPEQIEAQAFLRRLLNWRKQANVIHSGRLTHYFPMGGVYVYFRHNADQEVMVVLNKNHAETSLDLRRFAEQLKPGMHATDVLSGRRFALEQALPLPARSALVLELGRAQ